MTKNDLRKTAKAILSEAGKKYFQTAGNIISDKVIGSEEFLKSRTVFIYVSTENEPSTEKIINVALKSGKKVCVPKCVSKTEMKAVEIKSPDELKAGAYGIRETESTGNEVSKEDIDLAIIPCVAASESGKRLGHGAGYYDRFLENSQAFKMCLCYGKLTFDDIPTDEHDIIMDKVITE